MDYVFSGTDDPDTYGLNSAEPNSTLTAFYKGGDDEHRNSAVIHVDIDMGSGNDSARQGGAGGNIRLGDGDDLFGGSGGTDREGQPAGSGTLVVLGEGGNDVFEFDGGQITLDGGAGDDIFRLRGFTLALTLYGGSGFDVLSVEAGTVQTTIASAVGIEGVFATAGDDVFTVYGGPDAEPDPIRGFANIAMGHRGSDEITGAGGKDLLAGAGSPNLFLNRLISPEVDHLALPLLGDDDGAVDRLYGLGGDDTLMGGLGADVLDGGEGSDTVSYHDRTPEFAGERLGIVVNMATGENPDDDTWISIENVTGTRGGNFGFRLGDLLTGDDGNNVISGLGDSDELHGGAGNDTLDGGEDSDILYGEAGDDWLIGGKDGDYVTSSEDRYRERANDQLYGGEGFDVLVGGMGDDLMDGGTNPSSQGDIMLGGAGNDRYYVDSPLDLVDEGFVFPDAGFGGNDIIYSTSDFFWDVYGVGETLFIQPDAVDPEGDGVTIVGGIGDNSIWGNDGINIMFGRGGSDTYYAGAGTDFISFSTLGVPDGAGGDGYVANGVNTLVMLPGNGYDIVFEFESGRDKVDVDSFGLESAEDLFARGYDDGIGNSYFVLGDGFDYLYMVGLELADLQAGDFIV